MIMCENCENMVAIGGGDHICIATNEPKLVVADYMPADSYVWCEREHYEEQADRS